MRSRQLSYFNLPLAPNTRTHAKLTLAPKLITTVEISQETGTPMTSTPTGGQPVEVVLEPGEGRLFALLEYIKK